MSTVLERLPAQEPSAVVALQLWLRRYESRFGELRGRYNRATVSDDQIHDACVDAIEEIRASGRHIAYSSLTEVEFVRRSEFRLLDSIKRAKHRGERAPQVAFDEETVTASMGGSADALTDSLRHVSSIGRLRELVLALKPAEAQFWWLTHGVGLSRDEAAEAMDISVSSARRLVTAVQKRLKSYALGEGAVCEEFDQLVRLRLEQGGRRAALGDQRVQAHLAWCETCPERVQRLDADLKLIAPLLPLCAAAKAGIVAGLLGGGGGVAAAAGGGGGVLSAGAGKALVVASVIAATGGTAAVVEHVESPRAPAKRAPAAPRKRVSQETLPARVVPASPTPAAATGAPAMGRRPAPVRARPARVSKMSRARARARRVAERAAKALSPIGSPTAAGPAGPTLAQQRAARAFGIQSAATARSAGAPTSPDRQDGSDKPAPSTDAATAAAAKAFGP